MTQRERFEAWARTRIYTMDKFTDNTGDVWYKDKKTSIAFEAWQASEAASLELAAQLCDEYGDLAAAEKDSALLVGKVELSNAMSGEPRAAEFLAKAIRALKES